MNFIAYDFETANGQLHSACSLALVMVKDNKIVGNYYSLIKPETEFHYRNIQIHGIHPEDVASAPSFVEVWDEIAQYFQENRLIVAHNASFDNRVLASCLSYYGLPKAHFMSLCTVRTSRKLYQHLPNHRLDTVCRYLSLNLEQHHHALDDSLACANILLKQEAEFGVQPLKQLVKHI